MKRILLPTDFSDNAYNAIKYAVQFFKDETCTFYLLNTFTPISYTAEYLIENPAPYGIEEVALGHSKKEIEKVAQKIQIEFPNEKHQFVKLSAFNMLIAEIKDVIETYNIDLIIMGTKGATGLKEVLIGSQTMYTMKKVKCPIIAVPDGFVYEKPKEILFPTDYNLNTSNPILLPLIKSICDIHNSRLHILNAYYGVPLVTQQQDTKVYLDTYFEENAHVFEIADGMDVIEAIEDYQKYHIINLLVMVHNKHSFFENLLFKPVINQIAYHLNVPFLVIPSIERQ
ncbi:hypothetical protein GCM10009430_43560 [Aquimarina litoralis]|uniref:UspA domain-containing protein n=1 Tax=Aquimarina litoralis TaxID=584605 RepID=A0ABP3UEA8_9FLAO